MEESKRSIRISRSDAGSHVDRTGISENVLASIQGFTLHRCRDEQREEGDTNIFMFQRVYRQVMEHLSADTMREHGGVLLGYELRTETPTTWITHALPARDTQGSATHLKFDFDTWRQLDEQEAVFSELGLRRVGWYHSHPNISIFLSDFDLDVCTWFNKPTQVALVVDPVNCKGAFFVHGRAGYRKHSAQGFWEVHDLQSESICKWSNLDRPAFDGPAIALPLLALPPEPVPEPLEVETADPETPRVGTFALQKPGWLRAVTRLLPNASMDPRPSVVTSAWVITGLGMAALLSFLVLWALDATRYTKPVADDGQGNPSLVEELGSRGNEQFQIKPAADLSSLAPGGMLRFRAEGPSGKDVPVRWELSGESLSRAGSINQTGQYTAPGRFDSPRVVEIRAVSLTNDSVWAKYQFKITPRIEVATGSKIAAADRPAAKQRRAASRPNPDAKAPRPSAATEIPAPPATEIPPPQKDLPLRQPAVGTPLTRSTSQIPTIRSPAREQPKERADNPANEFLRYRARSEQLGDSIQKLKNAVREIRADHEARFRDGQKRNSGPMRTLRRRADELEDQIKSLRAEKRRVDNKVREMAERRPRQESIILR